MISSSVLSLGISASSHLCCATIVGSGASDDPSLLLLLAVFDDATLLLTDCVNIADASLLFSDDTLLPLDGVSWDASDEPSLMLTGFDDASLLLSDGVSWDDGMLSNVSVTAQALIASPKSKAATALVVGGYIPSAASLAAEGAELLPPPASLAAGVLLTGVGRVLVPNEFPVPVASGLRRRESFFHMLVVVVRGEEEGDASEAFSTVGTTRVGVGTRDSSATAGFGC